MKLNLLYRLVFILAIPLASICFDQWTKKLATEHLLGQPQKSYLADTFRLTYVKNEGAFLSLGSQLSESYRNWALKIFPVVLLIGLLAHMILSKTMTVWQLVAFCFILGGGISNIYDRLEYGSVIDFMNLGIKNLRTGIFNFADVSIMTGLFMMLPTMFKKKKQEEQS